jgi:hypothetical protein
MAFVVAESSVSVIMFPLHVRQVTTPRLFSLFACVFFLL